MGAQDRQTELKGKGGYPTLAAADAAGMSPLSLSSGFIAI